MGFFSYDPGAGVSGIGGLGHSSTQYGFELTHRYDELGRLATRVHARRGESEEQGYSFGAPEETWLHGADVGDTRISPAERSSYSPLLVKYDPLGEKASIENGSAELLRAGRYSVQTHRSSGARTHQIDLGFALVRIDSQSDEGPAVEIEYLLTDAVGSTLHRESMPGRSTFTVMGAYGGLPAPSASSETQLLMAPGFGGHNGFVEAGLVDMNARVYVPSLGIFVSPDPVLPDIHNPLSYSPYVYVFNDPGSLTDPTGEFACAGACIAGIVGAGAGVISGIAFTAQQGGGGRDYLLNASVGAVTGFVSGWGSVALFGATPVAGTMAGVLGGGSGGYGSAHLSANYLGDSLPRYGVGSGSGLPTVPATPRQPRQKKRSNPSVEAAQVSGGPGTVVTLSTMMALEAANHPSGSEEFLDNLELSLAAVSTLAPPPFDTMTDTAGGLVALSRGDLAGASMAGMSLIPIAGRAAAASRAAQLGCFPGDTLVVTEHGVRSIDVISLGDRVYCASTPTSTLVSIDDVHWSLCDVESLITYEHEGAVVDVAIGAEVLTSTADHPYWVVSGASLELRPVASDAGSKDPISGSRWVEAQDLQAGDRLALLSGGMATVGSTTLRLDRFAVYNLTVAQHASFAVGTRGVLAHNSRARKAGARVLGICFGEGTLVETDEGLTRIEEIEAGDMVWPADEVTGEPGWGEVVRTFERECEPTIEVEYVTNEGAYETIVMTPEHPVWTAEGWDPANGVAAGGELKSSDGWVELVRSMSRDGCEPVYNLEVADHHTYHVGENGLWVHNASKSGLEHLSRSQLKSLRSLNQRLAEHRQKLADFIANLAKFDNKGFLKNASNAQVRQRIIDGRVRHLQNEIDNFTRQIDSLMSGGR